MIALTKPRNVSLSLQLIHYPPYNGLSVPLIGRHHVFVATVRLFCVPRIRLPIRQSDQCRLCVHPRFLFPALSSDLMQRLGHARILQQRLAPRRVHSKLCDRLGKVLTAVPTAAHQTSDVCVQGGQRD